MLQAERRSRARWVTGVLHQYGFRMLLGEIPRLYFGNDAGLTENLTARCELRRLRSKAPSAPDGVDQRSESLRRDGYVLLGQPYEPELVRVIHAKFQQLITDPVASRAIGPRVKDAIRGIVDPLDRIPELQHLLSSDICCVLHGYYGTYFRVEHVRLWRNVHVGGAFAQQDVYSNLWHNDHDPVTLIRLFVYMSDNVTRDTGATRFHSISTTKQIIRRGYLRRRAVLPPARRLLEDESRMLFFEGDVGSACLLNPQLCLHRAGVPRSGAHRDIVQFTIGPSQQRLSDNWAAELPPDPAMHGRTGAMA